MKIVAATAIALAWAGVVWGAEVPAASIASYAAHSRAERPKSLKMARAKLRKAEKDRRGDRAKRKATIDELRAYIEFLENPAAPYYGTARFTLANAKVGDVGHVRESATVEGIVDNSIAVATARYTPPASSAQDLHSRIQSGTRSFATAVVWVDVPSARGAEVGKPFYVNALLVRTADGFEPANLEKYADQFTRQTERREWSTDSGERFHGVLIRNERGTATIVDLDGKRTEVRLTELSDDDREFVREASRKAR